MREFGGFLIEIGGEASDPENPPGKKEKIGSQKRKRQRGFSGRNAGGIKE
ncbi:hypothetical protein LFML04_0762 [Leptospirillum ferriphilum ML-04]|uniref:Uncharacterized protein n=1 Tax=Leptospirillum ferriphilum (strain ML-04) TaxID=1048260 RepID=J9Z9Z1_LEPFM|nr:hypothetical protein LFML04_0762 [Leptospirillum ferriphilum ML-04]